MSLTASKHMKRSRKPLSVFLASAVLLAVACARLPYTTRVLHSDARVVVKLQQEVTDVVHAHPLRLTAKEVAAMLRGFSIREEKVLPLRWFAEEKPPVQLFRLDEIQVLAPHLASALEQVGPTERVAFQLLAPGLNPVESRDVTAGWLAVCERYLHVVIEHFHTQLPVNRFSPYDFNFPTPPGDPGSYVLYFEPGRYWVAEQAGEERRLDYQGFLKSAYAPVLLP